MKIGLVGDSQGDIDALEWACDLLLDEHGAERIFFLGGRWLDLDELFQRKREQARGRREYTDEDFLADVAAFVAAQASERAGGVAHRVSREGADAFIRRFARVPDRASIQYRDPAIARVLPELVGDRIACLVYDKADLTREDIEMASLLVHGNSREPNLVQIGPRVFVTPGSLTGVSVRTCAVLGLERGRLELSAYGLDGRLVKQLSASFSARMKMTAR